MNTVPLDIISVILGSLKKYDIINFLSTCKIYCNIEHFINLYDNEILNFIELNTNEFYYSKYDNSKLGVNNLPEFEYLHVSPKYLNINQTPLNLLQKCLRSQKTMYILDTNIEGEKSKILVGCNLLYCKIPEQINNLCLFNLKNLILYINNSVSSIYINAPNLKELYIISKENDLDIKINTKKLKTLCIPNVNFSNYFYKNFEQIENLIIYNNLYHKIEEGKIQNLYITCNKVNVCLLQLNTVKIYINYNVLLEDDNLYNDWTHIFIGNYETKYINLKKEDISSEEYIMFHYYPNNALIDYCTDYNNSLLTIEKNERFAIHYMIRATSMIKHTINRLTIDIEKFNIYNTHIDELTLFTCRTTNIYVNNCSITRISFEGCSTEYECEDPCEMNIIISNCKIETLNYNSFGTITILDSKIDDLYVLNAKKKILNRYIEKIEYKN